MSPEVMTERLSERLGWLANPENSASSSYAAVAADARELERLLLEEELLQLEDEDEETKHLNTI